MYKHHPRVSFVTGAFVSRGLTRQTGGKDFYMSYSNACVSLLVGKCEASTFTQLLLGVNHYSGANAHPQIYHFSCQYKHTLTTRLPGVSPDRCGESIYRKLELP